MPWLAALVPLVTGVAQMVSSNNKQKKLEGQMQSYQAPNEVDKIVQSGQNSAQEGFSPETMSFLTNSIRGASSNAVNAVNRAGGTPNDVSGILAREIDSYMRLGAENSMQQFKNFDRYINSLGASIQSQDAEWADRRNLLKDQMQQAAVDKNQGFQNIGAAATAGAQYFSDREANERQMELYKELYKMNNASNGLQWQQLMSGLSTNPGGANAATGGTQFLPID